MWRVAAARATAATLGVGASPYVAEGVEIGVVVGAWLDPDVRSASLVGLAWIVAALTLYLVRFRRAEPENRTPSAD